MPREDVIKVEGRVVEILQDTLYRVELANGHRLIAHISRKMRLNLVRIEMGEKVTLEMSPYDLSEGRIVSSGVQENATK